ncbi:GWxTD domain-containing protein [Rhodocaloribacter sp.]
MAWVKKGMMTVLAAMLWLSAGEGSRAQRPDSVEAAQYLAFAGGVEAVETGAYERAVSRLEALLAQAPAYAEQSRGTAAYWLGRAYERLGDRDNMQRVWRTGLIALDRAGFFDLRLTDAYLRSLTAEQRAVFPGETARLYLSLLAALDEPLFSGEVALMARHVAQLAVILPDDVLDEIIANVPTVSADEWTFKPGAGTRLLAWWRSQDPLPATLENERLLEHLERVAYAEAHFAYPGRLTGFDDRGEIYVRYGKPDKELEISFTDPWLIDVVFQPGVGVTPSDFPENVFWRYGDIDRAAYFLFVKKTDHFAFAQTIDLIPKVLRFGFSRSKRGIDKATRMIAVLRSIYQQLAPLHSDFEARYSDVENYAMELPAFQPGRILNRTRRISRIPAGIENNTVRSRPSPDVFAQTILMRTESEDEMAYGRREAYAPREVTDVFRETERLPVEVRVARFLDDDGRTRTEIYWSPSVGAIRPSKKLRKRLRKQGYDVSDTFVINMTTVQKTEQHQPRVVNQKRYFLTDVPEQDDAIIPVQTMVVRGDTGRYHLAFQWDEYLPGTRTGTQMSLGPKVKMGAGMADSLSALVADGRMLEMSDLKPIFTRKGDENFLDDPASASPYPFSRITSDVQLALYFEVYHLTFGADDLAHYTVEYEIARSEDKGGLLRLLGGKEEARTSSRISNTGRGRTAKETIFLDLSDWTGNGELEVRVRVTDETTGQNVERTLNFHVQNAGG